MHQKDKEENIRRALIKQFIDYLRPLLIQHIKPWYYEHIYQITYYCIYDSSGSDNKEVLKDVLLSSIIEMPRSP
jgi:hypothetical protein